MVYHSPCELLEEVLGKIPISSYIAGMLASSDLRTVCSALQKADILMSKMTNTFHVYFRREGVMYRIKSLAEGGGSSFSSVSGKGVGATTSSSTSSSPEVSNKHTNRGAVSASPPQQQQQDTIEVGSSSSTSK